MEEKGWKITAIIFIVLFALTFMYLVWAFNLGNEAIENKNECILNICDIGGTHDAYAYDEYNKICYCYTGEDITHEEYIK